MKKIILFICVVANTAVFAQLNKADEHFENFEYAKAITLYQRINERKADIHSTHRLAISYQKINDLEQAENWYRSLMEFDNVEPKSKLEFAKILIGNDKPEEAKIWINSYKQQIPEDEMAALLEENLESEAQFLVDSFFYRIEPVSINSEESSFSPTYFENGILFASQRPTDGKNETDTWTGKNCFNLFYAEKSQDGTLKTPQLLTGEIKSPFHEASAAYVEGAKRLYFTRSNVYRNHLEKDDESVNNLQIYTATLDNDNRWNNVEKLSFNNDQYSYGHPTLTKDGKTMYFVSDIPGGAGETDIYQSTFDGTSWSKPENLGKRINTFGKEMFPYLDDSGDTTKLYYSTDGKPGLGGLDIFYSNFINGEWSTPVHMSFPINSHKDDFGIVYRFEDRAGYFSSNRNGENGYDQIYAFELVDQDFFLAGDARDLKTKKPLADVAVKVMNRTLKNVKDVTTSDDGEFFFQIEKNSDFIVTGDLKGYFSDSKNTSTKGMRKSDTVYVSLLLDMLEVEKTIRLDNIYYDFDKWDIRPDAEQELNRLVATLKENPDVKIELSSHTDCRGSDSYNKKLSQKRAQSAVDYIVNHGIERKRMIAKGYGETKLLNNCDDGVECTEDQHQFNRRTEFKVVE